MNSVKYDIARQSLWSVVGLSIILLALFFVRYRIAPFTEEIDMASGTGLGAMLSGWLWGKQWLSSALFLALAVFNSMLVTRIATGNMLFVPRSLIPILLCIIVSCGFYMTCGNINGMVCSLLFIRGSRTLISSFRHAMDFRAMLQGGLAIGLMPLFWAPAVIMAVALPAAIVIFRRTWREAVVGVAGLIMPLAVFSYVEWLGGGDFMRMPQTIIEYVSTPGGYTPLRMSPGHLAFSCIFILLLFLSLGTYFGTARTMRTRPARIMIYFIVMLAAGLSIFTLPGRNAMLFPLVSSCVAIVSTTLFVKHTGLLSALLYIVIIVCGVVINVIPLL